MRQRLNISSLETQTVEVMQFEHNVTTVEATFTADDISEDIMELKPCILLSLGEEITEDNGLSYIVADDTADIGWCISERYTQKAGTYFAQFAFIDKNETVKVYTDKFTFKVLPSVDIQKAAFEYKPRFIEAFWNKIVAKIGEMLPKKVSELENDASYVSTKGGLSEYAKTTEVNSKLTAYSKKSDVDGKLESYPTTAEVDEKLGAYATKQEVTQTLESYPTTEEVDGKLESYPTTEEVDGKLGDYPTTTETSDMISSYYKSKHTLITNKYYIPEEIGESTVSGITVKADSTGTYYESVTISKDKSSNALRLSDFTLNISTLKNTMDVTADLRVEINTTSTSGTTIIKFKDIFVSGETTNAYISYNTVSEIGEVRCSRLKYDNEYEPISTKATHLGISTSAYVRNIRLVFKPTSPVSPTTNFLSGVRISVFGTKYVA